MKCNLEQEADNQLPFLDVDVLRKHNIRTKNKTYTTTKQLLANHVDKIESKNHGVFNTSSENCSQLNIDTTNRHISVRKEEHQIIRKVRIKANLALFQLQHSTGYKINFSLCKQIANMQRQITIRHRNRKSRGLEHNRRLFDIWKLIISQVNNQEEAPKGYSNLIICPVNM